MEACVVSGGFRSQSLYTSPQSFAFARIRELSLYRGTVCDLQHVAEKKKLENLNRMFVFGMGYSGHYFAHQLKQRGWEISGTCTSVSKKSKLEEKGYNAILFNGNDLEIKILGALQSSTHLLVTIPPLDGLGDPVLLKHLNLLRKNLGNGVLQRICYLSSTSVYGDCGGNWVDEDYIIDINNERTKARISAEKGWLDLGHDLDVPVHVFRLGGIYGPGRSALDTILKNESLSARQKKRESRTLTSRVHVADICQALMASIVAQVPSRVYNVVDDDPAPRIEVFTFARALIQEKWPDKVKKCSWLDQIDAAIEEVTKRGKRVSNARLKKELGVILLHPTYRSGLHAIAEKMSNSFCM